MSQRQSWGSVAQGWRTWWPHIEKAAQKLSTRLVELAEIKLGQRVLDIATGIGEPAITAAKVVGPTGHVLATDISVEMLAIAKERAASIGFQNIIEFRESDAENLELPDSFFDAVLCRWGLMFLPNLDIALSQIHKSIVSGGRLAAAVWAAPSKVPFISLAFDTVTAELQLPPPPAGVPNAFSLAELNVLESFLIKAGFRDLFSQTFNLIFEFASPEDYARFLQAIAAPIHAMLANETEERKEEIWKAITEKAKRSQYFDANNGSLRMDNETICVVGTRT